MGSRTAGGKEGGAKEGSSGRIAGNWENWRDERSADGIGIGHRKRRGRNRGGSVGESAGEVSEVIPAAGEHRGARRFEHH